MSYFDVHELMGRERHTDLIRKAEAERLVRESFPDRPGKGGLLHRLLRRVTLRVTARGRRPQSTSEGAPKALPTVR